MKKVYILLLTISLFTLNSCSVYNFTGAKVDAKTFQVNYFQNKAELVEPGIERAFTQKLQNLILNQTNLSLTTSNADLVYEGEIVGYRITPMTATADQKAAQNRLTVTVNVRFTNKNHEEDSFVDKKFSFYQDYDGTKQLVGSELASVLDLIFERITLDIF